MDFLTLFTNTGTNISYYLLLASWLQTTTCGTRFPLMKLGLDNNIEPRETLAKLEKSGKVSPAVLKKLKRHLAAQQNGFESLVMMAAAVVAGNQANLGAVYMNRMTAAYLIWRIIFTRLYINQTTAPVAFLRSLAFFGGAGCFVTTFIKAGRAMNA